MADSSFDIKEWTAAYVAVHQRQHEMERAAMLDRVASLEVFLLERMTAQERANDLQRTEVLRRLDELNHAHAQARDDFTKFQTREGFELFKTDSIRFQQDVRERLATISGRNTAFVFVLGVGFSILQVILRFVK